MDTYFRGDSQELDFCRKVRAGGNHLIAAAAGGVALGGKRHLKLRREELEPVLEEYRKLPVEQRRPKLPPREEATPPRRKVPPVPPGALIVRGTCAYARLDDDGRVVREQRWYYRKNPDRWPVETQSDMLWLLEPEWRAMIPADPREGDALDVPAAVRRRFFGTMAIDFMEGSVNALEPREARLRLTVASVTDGRIVMRLEGAARLGRELDGETATGKRTRGSAVRVAGFVEVDRARGIVDRFDYAGVGRAWGNKMEYVRREMGTDAETWLYGLSGKLVTGRAPADVTPPYNLLHYGSAVRPYFPGR